MVVIRRARFSELERHLEFVQRMCVGSLVSEGKMQFSHKSFKDWLSSEASDEFGVNASG